eukprot:scpid105334/ scgid9529/ 
MNTTETEEQKPAQQHINWRAARLGINPMTAVEDQIHKTEAYHSCVISNFPCCTLTVPGEQYGDPEKRVVTCFIYTVCSLHDHANIRQLVIDDCIQFWPRSSQAGARWPASTVLLNE